MSLLLFLLASLNALVAAQNGASVVPTDSLTAIISGQFDKIFPTFTLPCESAACSVPATGASHNVMIRGTDITAGNTLLSVGQGQSSTGPSIIALGQASATSPVPGNLVTYTGVSYYPPSAATLTATRPSNVYPSASSDCAKYGSYLDGDDGCMRLCIRNGISYQDLLFLNPGLKEDCSNLWKDTLYCVQPVGNITTYSGYLGMVTSRISTIPYAMSTAWGQPAIPAYGPGIAASGNLTQYDPTKAKSACGATITDDMLVVSLGYELFDYYGPRLGSNANPLCGKKLIATTALDNIIRQATLTVVDRCMFSLSPFLQGIWSIANQRGCRPYR